jgi:DNA-binding MurR/RpiR family transcriptional regulator
MNAAEKKAAEFILANGERVLDMTISDVATVSGVSETTIFKLCRTLGYGGFRDFKLAFARQSVSQISKPYEPAKQTDDAKTVAQKVTNVTVEILQDTLKVLDFDELERACTSLKKARKVFVMALSISRSTAIFAADKLSFFGIDAYHVIDTHLQAIRASLMTPKDVLLGFSRSGDTRDLIDVTQIAKTQGAKTIGVTNNPRPYFAKMVDIKLIARSKDTRFRNDILASRIEHLSIVDVLYTMMAVRNKSRASKLFKKINEAAAPKQY